MTRRPSGQGRDAARRRLDQLPEFLTRAQVAAVVQVSERTVDRHIRSGRLLAQKTNGHVRIHRDAVLAWLAAVAVIVLMAFLVLVACSLASWDPAERAMDALGLRTPIGMDAHHYDADQRRATNHRVVHRED